MEELKVIAAVEQGTYREFSKPFPNPNNLNILMSSGEPSTVPPPYPSTNKKELRSRAKGVSVPGEV